MPVDSHTIQCSRTQSYCGSKAASRSLCGCWSRPSGWTRRTQRTSSRLDIRSTCWDSTKLPSKSSKKRSRCTLQTGKYTMRRACATCTSRSCHSVSLTVQRCLALNHHLPASRGKTYPVKGNVQGRGDVPQRNHSGAAREKLRAARESDDHAREAQGGTARVPGGSKADARQRRHIVPDRPAATEARCCTPMVQLQQLQTILSGSALLHPRACMLHVPIKLEQAALHACFCCPGDNGSALESLATATALHPTHPKATLALGSVLQDNLDLDGALQQYRIAVQVHPTVPQVHHSLCCT